ncbi:MAG: PAS domain-containing protein [Candidatus Protochlamydia sp.]|nr:PAS domain-containing protein [Candidatus Protochlamydia sp.]
MLSFRQKIFFSYATVFFIFIILLLPFISHWVHQIILKGMQDRASEIIANVKNAPNNEALIRRLKDQKRFVFFRIGVITDDMRPLYDSHVKQHLLNYEVHHPEVRQALKTGVGFHEEYSKLLHQKFSYTAKAFDFHGKTYVLRLAFPHQYVNEITHDFEVGFLIFATAILLMFSLMTWFAIHHLTKPIQRIIKTVKGYGSNQTLPAIDVSMLNEKDEFTKLALTLNSLSAKIQNHIDIITHERNEKEAILESLVEGVIAVDGDLIITYANHTAVRLIGKGMDLIGQRFCYLKQERCFTLLKRCQEENKPLTDTLEVYIDGKKTYLDIVAAPKKDNGGAILVLQDKTAHYKIFEMRRDFIANASHELKTPITVIRGFAEALHDNPGLPQKTQEEVTAKILRNCNRMAALIKDLLTLADIENIPTSRLSHCDIHALTQRCEVMLYEVFSDAQVNIIKKRDEIVLIADEDLLDLALMNLIENAAKYSSRPANITITLDQTPEHVLIEITDQGIGIPVNDQEQIFDRFYTVDKAHSQKMGGSGLGLSIVKTIVEKHFGTIELQSELGKGSTFTITLPKIEIKDLVNFIS